jgi:hypothetical protein
MTPQDWSEVEKLLSSKSPSGKMVFAALDGILFALQRSIQNTDDPIVVMPPMLNLTYNEVLKVKAIEVCKKMQTDAEKTTIDLVPAMNWQTFANTVLVRVSDLFHP